MPKVAIDIIGMDYFQSVTDASFYAYRESDADGLMIYIGHLPRLQQLRAHSSRVTDGGMANLQGLSELSHLAIDNTRVSDAGIAHSRWPDNSPCSTWHTRGFQALG